MRARRDRHPTFTAPLGPYTKRGIIIDNVGCDPETWNNHGSIEEVNGSWYVFYHRSSQNSRFNRRLCIEPIRFESDGTIPEVPMATGGVEVPLDPRRFIDASRACLLSGTLYDGPAACYRSLVFASQTRFECFSSSATYGG